MTEDRLNPDELRRLLNEQIVPAVSKAAEGNLPVDPKIQAEVDNEVKDASAELRMRTVRPDHSQLPVIKQSQEKTNQEN
jgi:hypothetical protein